MAASRAGVPVYADTAALSRLSRSLRRAAPVAWATYKATAREAAGVILEDAQSRASFSQRIPGSGSVQVTGGGNVKIVFTAPNAAPIENQGRGFVRHPVYGHMDRWTDENSRPAFASPALEAHIAPTVAKIDAALREAVARTLSGGA